MAETILMRFHPTRLAFTKFYLLGALLVAASAVLYNLKLVPTHYALIPFPLGILAFAAAEILVKITHYTLTDFRITVRSGLLSRHESSVTWDRIANVEMKQTLVERPLNIGTIIIDSTGGDQEPEIVMSHISRVSKIKQTVDEQMFRKKHGGPGETSTPLSGGI